ncbi:MAG: hypothetical protein K2K90_05365, partial [Lachnospiraceae bacterium]|nr:hypothetical protein [Lachnospiraceae bacterium]
MIVDCGDLTILLLGLAFHCFLQKKENRYATALAGHRAAILFNQDYYYNATYLPNYAMEFYNFLECFHKKYPLTERI